ncbi:MAG: hypothetical protein ACTS73_00080 [Arsenophonus sp. NEOnobi-MAG3]
MPDRIMMRLILIYQRSHAARPAFKRILEMRHRYGTWKFVSQDLNADEAAKAISEALRG